MLSPEDWQNEAESIIDELMEEDDGYRYDSPIPKQEQMESRRRHYRESLTFKPLHAKIVLAMASVQSQGMVILNGGEFDSLVNSLREAGERMQVLPSEVLRHPQGLKQAIGLSDEAMLSLMRVGQYCFTLERYDRAAAVFALMVILDQSCRDSWYCWGASEQAAGETAEAIKAYRGLAELDPEEGLPHLLLAECYLGRQERSRAEEHLSKGAYFLEGGKGTAEERWMLVSLQRELGKVRS